MKISVFYVKIDGKILIYNNMNISIMILKNK